MPEVEELEAVVDLGRKWWLAVNERVHRNLGRSGVALAVLLMKGPLTMGEAAKELGLTTGALTGLADRMVAQGWATREMSRSDRRRWTLTLTDEAMEILVEVFVEVGEAMNS